MKTRFLRLFGIGLTLALIASLFAFNPVSAKNDKNDKFFDLSIEFSAASTGRDDSNVVDEWLGAPGIYQGKELLGSEEHYGVLLLTYDITGGTFGEGEATLEYDVVANFIAGKLVEHSTWILSWDNEEYQGAITVTRDTYRDFTGWNASGRATWEVKSSHHILYGTTGDFKGLHFTEVHGTAVGTGTMTATAFWSS